MLTQKFPPPPPQPTWRRQNGGGGAFTTAVFCNACLWCRARLQDIEGGGVCVLTLQTLLGSDRLCTSCRNLGSAQHTRTGESDNSPRTTGSAVLQLVSIDGICRSHIDRGPATLRDVEGRSRAVHRRVTEGSQRPRTQEEDAFRTAVHVTCDAPPRLPPPPFPAPDCSSTSSASCQRCAGTDRCSCTGMGRCCWSARARALLGQPASAQRTACRQRTGAPAWLPE